MWASALWQKISKRLRVYPLRSETEVGLTLIRALVANGTRIIYVTELSASSSEQVRVVCRCKATWEREFKLPWREASSPNHHHDIVDSDQ